MISMKMFYKKLVVSLTVACAVVTGCSDEDFVDINKNPDVLNDISPENQFMNAVLNIHNQDFEAYYDMYRRTMPWMQYVTPLNGNVANFTRSVGNFSNRYDHLYKGVGDALTDMEHLIGKLPEEEQAQHVHMLSIAQILKAYYAFYVSDIYGSIPYEDAWQARYGGTLLPKYQNQQSLFAQLDTEITGAIATLKAPQAVTQNSFGNFDPYYGGDVTSWIKAANALRLKIAMRLSKRDEAKLRSVAQEVLADAANLMSSNAEGWFMKSAAGLVSGGNFNPDALYATKPLVDFMWDHSDPRLDAFFAPNTYSQDTIDILIDQGKLEPGTTEAARRYFGSFTSPDESAAPENQKYYTRRIADVNDEDVQVDTLSLIQRRLFQPSFDEGNGTGDGVMYLPVITYAEFCFMRAELAANEITTEDAETFYNAGVRASIQWYDQVAKDSKLSNYSPVTDAEIDDYLAQPGVIFDATKALDQISSQAFLHFFKQPQEGWALWKRTGLPNTTTVLPLTDMTSSGVSLPIPRRSPLPLLSEEAANYENQKAAYDEMAQDPGFGAGPNDAFGRVWWDQE